MSFVFIFVKGNCGESSAKKVGVTRQDQDEYAVNSYKKTAEAWKVSCLNLLYLVEMSRLFCTFFLFRKDFIRMKLCQLKLNKKAKVS